MGIFGNLSDKKDAELVAPRWIEIVNDCRSILDSTVNPNIFFSRYDLLIETLTNLSKIERYLHLSTMPSVTLRQIKQKEDSIIQSFLRRSMERLNQDVEKLKTVKGKTNKIAAYFEEMNEYTKFMSKDTVFMLNDFNTKFLESMQPH